MKTPIAAAVTTSLGLMAAMTLAASPSAAASPSPATETAGENQCVVNLDTRQVGCADDGHTARRLAAVRPRAVNALTLYDGTNYRGASITFTVSRSCTPSYDGEYGLPDLADYGWNNRASSLRTYNRCDAHLHDGANYTGAASTWIDRSANLGAIGSGWSNRASSIGIS